MLRSYCQSHFCPQPFSLSIGDAKPFQYYLIKYNITTFSRPFPLIAYHHPTKMIPHPSIHSPMQMSVSGVFENINRQIEYAFEVAVKIINVRHGPSTLMFALPKFRGSVAAALHTRRLQMLDFNDTESFWARRCPC